MPAASIGSPTLWIGFAIGMVVMMALDLGVFHRNAHTVSVREAAIWSAVWIALALGFNAWIFFSSGREAAEAFFTGYVIEKALSVDNLFLFYVIFTAFGVAPQYQHKLLYWGILGALVMRAGMVFGGTALLTRFHWAVYVFGVLLLLTGIRMLVRHDDRPHPERSRILGVLKRIIPTTDEPHGGNFFLRVKGRLHATPLLVTLLLIELSDVVFAVDSIPAIFAITTDPFIVFTSNVLAVMGLRSLFFVLAGMAERFVYLQPGLALVLVFVGAKMLAAEFVHIPVAGSLAVVALLLGVSILASVIKSRRDRREAKAGA